MQCCQEVESDDRGVDDSFNLIWTNIMGSFTDTGFKSRSLEESQTV